MLKKLFGSLAIFSLTFLLSFSISFAACGASGTPKKCGDPGGCVSATAVCIEEGPMWARTYRCEESPSCVNADSTTTYCGSWSTDFECGRDNGCKTGFMCTNDNGDNARCVTPTDESSDPACDIPPEEPTDPDEPDEPGTELFGCGQVVTDPNRTDVACECPAGTSKAFAGFSTDTASNQRCCGYVIDGSCSATAPEPEEPGGPTGGGDDEEPTDGDEEGVDEEAAPIVDIFDGPTSENFDQLNPLTLFGNEDSQTLRSPGAIVSRMLLFAFPLAGLILFVMIVWGGFEMLTSAASKGVEAGKQRVTAAIVGFVLLFVAFWVFQIVEVIFGVAIL